MKKLIKKPSFALIFIVLLISKLTDFIVVYLASFTINPLGFPHEDILKSYTLPSFLTSFGNFDGAHYISISDVGYQLYQQAFFPLYPMLIKLFSNFNNHN